MDTRSAVVPINCRDDGRKKFSASLMWKIFSSRICRNPFVRRFLFERSYGDCPWCGHLLVGNTVVHHIDYLHECRSSETVKLHSPTDRKPDRVCDVPDCESCHREFQRSFDACMSRIALVHFGCHNQIHRSAPTRACAREVVYIL